MRLRAKYRSAANSHSIRFSHPDTVRAPRRRREPISITPWNGARFLSRTEFVTPARICSSTSTPRIDGLAGAMTYSSVKRLLSRCSKRINYDLSGPHMLRHTFATRLIRGIDCDPVPVDVVQALLGHAALSSMQVYTHNAESTVSCCLCRLSIIRNAPAAVQSHGM